MKCKLNIDFDYHVFTAENLGPPILVDGKERMRGFDDWHGFFSSCDEYFIQYGDHGKWEGCNDYYADTFTEIDEGDVVVKNMGVCALDYGNVYSRSSDRDDAMFYIIQADEFAKLYTKIGE